MQKKAIELELVTTKIKRDSLQKLKVVASLEGMSLIDYVEWLTDKAYESANLGKRKHRTKVLSRNL
jgi:hypothetical protein